MDKTWKNIWAITTLTDEPEIVPKLLGSRIPDPWRYFPRHLNLTTTPDAMLRGHRLAC